MPSTSLILPDANVWLALAYAGHSSHEVAKRWLDIQTSNQLFFCRITQLSLLRHLCTRDIMKDDVLTQAQAWDVYEQIFADPRIDFVEEPAGLQFAFRSLSTNAEVSPKRWTDDYLAAFVRLTGLVFVTFDKALAARVPLATLLTR